MGSETGKYITCMIFSVNEIMMSIKAGQEGKAAEVSSFMRKTLASQLRPS